MRAREVIKVIGRRGSKLVVSCNGILLSKLGLGEANPDLKGTMLLDVSEAAYLIFNGLAKLVDGDGEVSLDKLFTKYSGGRNDWIKFVVLLDLRERGRRARAGFGDNDLIYEKGQQRIQVFVIEENSPLISGRIIEWTRKSIMKGFEPVIAVVDAHGDVTYYSTRILNLSDLKEVVGAGA